MSAETIDNGETVQISEKKHAGRKIIKHHIPTPVGEVEVQVKAAHSSQDATVRVLSYAHGEGETIGIHGRKLLDGWRGHGALDGER